MKNLLIYTSICFLLGSCLENKNIYIDFKSEKDVESFIIGKWFGEHKYQYSNETVSWRWEFFKNGKVEIRYIDEGEEWESISSSEQTQTWELNKSKYTDTKEEYWYISTKVYSKVMQQFINAKTWILRENGELRSKGVSQTVSGFEYLILEKTRE